MAEPVDWLADGTPNSARYGDVYRSCAGGLAQARHVFLQGCGLPQAWAGSAQWRILETGFGLGLNFLATWHAWRDDPDRAGVLHFVSTELHPVAAADLVRGAAPWPELASLAHELASRWTGLVPGAHRFVFDAGRVLLTLHVGDARDVLQGERFTADAVFLDGFDPRCNPELWDAQLLRSVARHCRRGTRLATWTVAGEVRRALTDCGFRAERLPGLPPKRERLEAVFDPAWEPRRTPPQAATPSRCVVIGSGLAGSAVAAVLARRGWEVTVLDAGDTPAAGASGLPVGLLAPHQSPDDNLLSRLSRAGVRATLQEAALMLRADVDWQRTGVLERRPDRDAPLPPPLDGIEAWTRAATREQIAAAGLPPESSCTWHELAAWVRPAALVQAWLATPGVRWQGTARVARVESTQAGAGPRESAQHSDDSVSRTADSAPQRWRVLDADGRVLAEAPLVIVAAALASADLVAGLSLRAVRGQITWGATAHTLPPFPVNGNGHFVPLRQDHGTAWFSGSTYGRGDADSQPREADHAANLARLRTLLPQVADTLADDVEAHRVHAWSGIRCASPDRRPLVGSVAPGLWVSCAMGSRGLTFAALCAQLISARLHAEPLPIEDKLARALDVARHKPLAQS